MLTIYLLNWRWTFNILWTLIDLTRRIVAFLCLTLFFLFDLTGHGGSRAAKYLKDHLFENLLNHPKFMTDTKLAISKFLLLLQNLWNINFYCKKTNQQFFGCLQVTSILYTCSMQRSYAVKCPKFCSYIRWSRFSLFFLAIGTKLLVCLAVWFYVCLDLYVQNLLLSRSNLLNFRLSWALS